MIKVDESVKKVNESYADIKVSGGLANVIGMALRNSNAQNFLRNVAAAVDDYEDNNKDNNPNIQNEVNEFWNSFESAWNSIQNGYY